MAGCDSTDRYERGTAAKVATHEVREGSNKRRRHVSPGPVAVASDPAATRAR